MIFLLDTAAVSALMREDPGMISWLSGISSADRVITCVVVRGEILFGLQRLARGERRAALEMKAQEVFAVLPCEGIPPGADEHYATVKLAQQRLGLPLDDNDLWIAATALAFDATIVSRDMDFQRVSELSVKVP